MKSTNGSWQERLRNDILLPYMKGPSIPDLEQTMEYVVDTFLNEWQKRYIQVAYISEQDKKDLTEVDRKALQQESQVLFRLREPHIYRYIQSGKQCRDQLVETLNNCSVDRLSFAELPADILPLELLQTRQQRHLFRGLSVQDIISRAERGYYRAQKLSIPTWAAFYQMLNASDLLRRCWASGIYIQAPHSNPVTFEDTWVIYLLRDVLGENLLASNPMPYDYMDRLKFCFEQAGLTKEVFAQVQNEYEREFGRRSEVAETAVKALKGVDALAPLLHYTPREETLDPTLPWETEDHWEYHFLTYLNAVLEPDDMIPFWRPDYKMPEDLGETIKEVAREVLGFHNSMVIVLTLKNPHERTQEEQNYLNQNQFKKKERRVKTFIQNDLSAPKYCRMFRLGLKAYQEERQYLLEHEEEVGKYPLDILDIDRKTYDILADHGVETVEDAAKALASTMPNFGNMKRNDLKEALLKVGCPLPFEFAWRARSQGNTESGAELVLQTELALLPLFKRTKEALNSCGVQDLQSLFTLCKKTPDLTSLTGIGPTGEKDILRLLDIPEIASLYQGVMLEQDGDKTTEAQLYQLDTFITELPLKNRTINVVSRSNVKTVRDLIPIYLDKKVQKLRGAGAQTSEDIKTFFSTDAGKALLAAYEKEQEQE